MDAVKDPSRIFTHCRAVAYVRMSTSQQDLSIGTQLAAIHSYAEVNNLQVIRVYEDAARSGLGITNREGMKSMIRDVMETPRPFDVVLVYDVSRWGRFQDIDAAAYYEYTCRLHGAKVVYVQEKFGADEDPMTALLKAMQRTTAAKYSRDLGVKSRAGQDRAVQLGFQMGHLPCIGLSRIAIDRQGNRRPLAQGQHKAMQSEHIVWVPGPQNEIDLALRIFRQYADTNITIKGLARALCEEGLTASGGRPFTFFMVDRLLRTEALAGNFVWGRKRYFSESAYDKSSTVRAESVIEPVVPADLWMRVQNKLWDRRRLCRSKEDLLHLLREALAERPQLCPIDLEAMGYPKTAFVNAFGSVGRALALAGRDQALVSEQHLHRRVAAMKVGKRMTRDIALLLRSAAIDCCIYPKSRLLMLRDGLTLRVQLVWPRTNRDVIRWKVHKARRPVSDMVLLAQMDDEKRAIRFILLSFDQYRRADAWLGSDPSPGLTPITTREELIEAVRLQSAECTSAQSLIAQ
ncbi:recombinase family protein [Hydrogenophaga sp.]|uniref:recombinase family protein n=1 Tax=Hydrogenophaga sp. TaxID=1904254 RepID=UPI002719F098|nr:recombinase family protein [Hydrogenophaga sp.]MDO9433979.1 recombinase family protein [Hydrogenophaga sp.]